MRRSCAQWTALTALLLATLAIGSASHAQQKLPDSTLFTMYNVNHAQTQLGWSTCGSTKQSEGCYGAGYLGPFTDACAVVQSVPSPLNFNTVLRYIYVLDTGSSASGATLTAYKRTDMVTSSDDVITVTMIAVVPLPTLVAGAGVTCLMAQNPNYVYAATKQGTNVLAINKGNFTVTTAGATGFNVAAVTADSYGFVTIVWANDVFSDVTVLGPDGTFELGGGGSYFMINPIDAVYPSNYPPMN